MSLFRLNYCSTQNKYTLKIKIANSLQFLIAERFLFCFHCEAVSSHSPNTRVTSRSVVLPSSLLSWCNPSWLDVLLSGSNWKPITLLSKSIFTLIKKSLRDWVVGNDEFFLTRLISCYYFGFTGLHSLL